MRNTLTRTLSLRLTVLFLVLASGSTFALCQDRTVVTPISVIPQPREVAQTAARFPLNRDTRLTLADQR